MNISGSRLYYEVTISSRKNVILLVCDKLSKIAYFIAITEDISAKGLARLFKDNMWKLHG